MPPKSSTKKRVLAEVEPNKPLAAPPAKRQSRAKPKPSPTAAKQNSSAMESPAASNAGTAPKDPLAASSSTANNADKRIRTGPNGERFLPTILPQECLKAMQAGKIPLPADWLQCIDADPSRDMTLGSRTWWEEHGDWLEENRKCLGLTKKHWEKKDTAMAMEKEKAKPDEGNDDFDWICRSRPGHDIAAERRGDVDSDSEDVDDDGEDAGDVVSESDPKPKTPKLDYKLASLHPDHIWICTMRGIDRANWWMQETYKRDQDSCCVHIYNNWSCYGVTEVMQNLFAAYDKALKDKQATPLSVWAEIEGLTIYVHSGCLDILGMSDDSDGIAKMLEMVGMMVISAIQFLIQKDEFKSGSEIRDLGLVLAQLAMWAESFGHDVASWESALTWNFRVMELAAAHGVFLAGPYGAARKLGKIKASARDAKKWKAVDWAKQLKKYTASYGPMDGPGCKPRLGGTHYDITEMSAAERKRYYLG